jgi:hypothetical protein
LKPTKLLHLWQMEHGVLTPDLRSLFLSRPEVGEIIKFDHEEILDQLVFHRKLVELLAALEKKYGPRLGASRTSIEVPIPPKPDIFGGSKPKRDIANSGESSEADEQHLDYRSSTPPGMEWKFDFGKNDYVLRKKNKGFW